EQLVERTLAAFGGIDILVNNSGGPPRTTAHEANAEAVETAVELLLLSVIRLTTLCLPHLERSGHGRVLNITSSPVREPIGRLAPHNAHPLADIVRVPRAKPSDMRGGIYDVDLLERKASLLERMFPSLREGATVVQHDELTPPGVTDRQRLEADRLDMRLSQQVASAVALRALGYDVRIRENGVRVALVYAQTHAAGKLRP